MSGALSALPPLLYENQVRNALLEDLGRAGDVTTDAIVPEEQRARMVLRARQDGVLAGREVAALAFRMLDPHAHFDAKVEDGERLAAGQVIAILEGSARALLTAERTALNFLCHLSGIATATRRIADAISSTRATLVCTRKTTPGLRTLEKYAVRAGGGANHRFGLDDAILIKDNHIALAGGIGTAIERARARSGHMMKIEVEVDRIDQIREVLDMGADAILLDNMTPAQLTEAVNMVGGKAITEASGRLTAETVLPVAESGVDLISVGWLTHSAPILDIGLDDA